MKQTDLISFKKWFADFCGSFSTDNAEDQKNYDLKQKHTFNVCENIIAIARALSLSDTRILLAESTALFHDVGRFPQYARYKTFRDSKSVNHGVLGAQTLIEHRVLKILPAQEQELIIQSVKFHNAFTIPKKEKEEFVFYIRLIRDADKLDIWRVFLEYYESPNEDRASAVGLDLPDTAEYSGDVIACIRRNKVVSLSTMKTLNDFKLLQLSWIFDLNFLPSFQLLSERDYIRRISTHLPQTEEIVQLTGFLHAYVHQRMMSKSPASEEE